MRQSLRKRAGGFTLLELLVTLVIVALTAGIFSQALEQLYRIETLLSSGGLQGRTETVRMEWVRQALAALATGDAVGKGRLKGDGRSLEGMTGNPLKPGGGAYGPLSLKLDFNSRAGETRLLAAVGEAAGETQWVTLLAWPGDTGRWRYVDRKGEALEQWPPPLGESPRLPAAIVLEAPLEGASLIVAAPLAVYAGQPTRAEFEKM